MYNTIDSGLCQFRFIYTPFLYSSGSVTRGLHCFFSSHWMKRFWNDRNKLSHFWQNLSKYRLKNTDSKFYYNCETNDQNVSKCLRKNDRNVSVKKNRVCSTYFCFTGTMQLFLLWILHWWGINGSTIWCGTSVRVIQRCKKQNNID